MWKNSFHLNFNEKAFCPKHSDNKLRKEFDIWTCMNICEFMVDKFDCYISFRSYHSQIGTHVPVQWMCCVRRCSTKACNAFVCKERGKKTHTFHISVGISKASPWLLGLLGICHHMLKTIVFSSIWYVLIVWINWAQNYKFRAFFASIFVVNLVWLDSIFSFSPSVHSNKFMQELKLIVDAAFK